MTFFWFEYCLNIVLLFKKNSRPVCLCVWAVGPASRSLRARPPRRAVSSCPETQSLCQSFSARPGLQVAGASQYPDHTDGGAGPAAASRLRFAACFCLGYSIISRYENTVR